jgi:hypothetical protein
MPFYSNRGLECLELNFNSRAPQVFDTARAAVHRRGRPELETCVGINDQLQSRVKPMFGCWTAAMALRIHPESVADVESRLLNHFSSDARPSGLRDLRRTASGIARFAARPRQRK